jgi:hypothetical protein
VKTAGKKFGWNGQAAGGVELCLSTDNHRVATGQFIVTRHLVEEVATMEAQKLWQNVNNGAIIAMQLQHSDMFIFSDGTLEKEGRVPTPIMAAGTSR